MILREKCFPNSNKQQNETPITPDDFETLQITVKNLHTLISLLKCEEAEIVVSTLTALSNFVAKSRDNITVLFDNHVLDGLMSLVEHDDLVIRRSATKLLAQMTSLDIIQNFLINTSDKNYLRCFMHILHDDADIFMQEYLLTILSNCCDNIIGASKVLESSHLNIFLKTLQSIDPDVRKSTLGTLNKLLRMPMATEKLFSLKEFDFALLYDLLRDEYESIQELTLSFIEHFLVRNQDDNIQGKFRESGGLQKLLEVLQNDVQKDLHPIILRLLVLATENYKSAEYLQSILNAVEVSEILKIVEDSSDPMALQLMSNLAAIPEFRKVLYDLDILSLILRKLQIELNDDLLNPICSMIGNMCYFTMAANEFAEASIVLDLIDILGNGELDWEKKENAIFAVNELVSRDIRNCEKIVNTDNHIFFLKLARNCSVPMHIRLGSLKIISTLIKLPRFRKLFMQTAVIEDLSNLLKVRKNLMLSDGIDELKIASCSISTHLFIEEEARYLCLGTDFLNKLCSIISKENSLPVQLGALQLIQQLCNDEMLIQEIIKIGFLHVLLKHRKVMRHILPSWETCLQTILSGHLPLKFAITGRLSLLDITKNGFYAMKRHVYPLPQLEELLESKSSPMNYLYVINFSTSPISNSMREGGAESYIDSTEMFEEVPGEQSDSDSTSRIFDEEFPRLKPDPRLCESLEIFQRILEASESINTYSLDSPEIMDVSKIELRAKLLAKFVAQKLSTPNPEFDGPCTQHQLKLHLRELRETLETSIIPIGELQVGSHFERALLFKAIADQIYLPAALIRGEYGKSWIEIALPQLHKTSSRNLLPTKLLNPNYIIDLMDHPGDLIPTDSDSARRYLEYEPICSRQCIRKIKTMFS